MIIELYQEGMGPNGPFARMTRTNIEVSTHVCICRIWILDDCMPILISEILHQDTVSERLRRWTRNPLGSARRGSNPLGVDSGDLSSSSSPFIFLCISFSRILYGTSFCVCQSTSLVNATNVETNKTNETMSTMKP